MRCGKDSKGYLFGFIGFFDVFDDIIQDFFELVAIHAFVGEIKLAKDFEIVVEIIVIFLDFLDSSFK